MRPTQVPSSRVTRSTSRQHSEPPLTNPHNTRAASNRQQSNNDTTQRAVSRQHSPPVSSSQVTRSVSRVSSPRVQSNISSRRASVRQSARRQQIRQHNRVRNTKHISDVAGSDSRRTSARIRSKRSGRPTNDINIEHVDTNDLGV